MRFIFRWFNVASGTFVMASSWLFTMPSIDARWDVRVTGFVIAMAALFAIRLDGRPMSASFSVIDMFAGVWLLLSTTFVHGDLVAVWSNITLGLLAIVCATQAYDGERARRGAATEERA